MQEPVVPLYRHPLGGLLWETKHVEVLLKRSKENTNLGMFFMPQKVTTSLVR